MLINFKFNSEDEEKNMPKQNDRKSEQVFSKLSDCGYSKKVAATIWLWYNPSEKSEAASNFKPIVKK